MRLNRLAVTDADFFIPAGRVGDALGASIEGLGNPDWTTIPSSLEGALDKLGWTVTFDLEGNVVGLAVCECDDLWIDEFLVDTEECLERIRARQLLGALAPFVRAGSHFTIERAFMNDEASGMWSVECRFDGRGVELAQRAVADTNAEIQRVLVGPPSGARPSGFAVMRVEVRCPGDAAEVLARLRERWGVERPVELLAHARDWSWWTAGVVDVNELAVYVAVSGFPISGFDLLRATLMACGATRVEQGPAVDPPVR